MQWKPIAVWRAGFRLAPVTTLIITAAVVLQLGMAADQIITPDHSRGALRQWGAVTQLGMYRQTLPNGTMEAIPQMSGPFDLWDGQTWRILVSGFHHGGPLHLLMNCLALWYLGRLLEPRMGRIRYLLLFLSATVISLLPEYLVGNMPVGLSGAIYAVFGALLVLRRRDRVVAEALSETMVRFCIIWLFACIVLTQLDILRIANLAHFAGFGYGWIAGQVLFGRFASRPKVAWLFVAGHLLLVPVLYAVVHPVWNGRYQWYLALDENDPQKKLSHLQNAVERDPSLRGPWVAMARIQFRQNQLSAAWKTILTGLDYNRSDKDSQKIVRAIWQEMQTESQRQQALDLLRQTFGDEAADWQRYFGIRLDDPVAVGPRTPDRSVPPPTDPSSVSGSIGGRRYRFSLGPPPTAVKRDLSAPPVNPDDPASAAEGTGI